MIYCKKFYLTRFKCSISIQTDIVFQVVYYPEIADTNHHTETDLLCDMRRFFELTEAYRFIDFAQNCEFHQFNNHKVSN